MKTIPVIDVFAGPGGLGEGFSRLDRGKVRFRLVLSVEKEASAHATLLLRAFTREFPHGKLPAEFYAHLRGEIGREDLFKAHEKQYADALAEVLERPRELGNPADNRVIDKAIRERVGKSGNWILIGGPPCQAYSLAGRSRRAREDRTVFESDARHFLYREYLRLIRKHRPAVFVMENVKGLLSATVQNQRILGHIVADMHKAGYDLHSLGHVPDAELFDLDPEPRTFLLRAEDYGVPQTRHRLIIVGVRKDIGRAPPRLEPEEAPGIDKVIGDLPKLRSMISGKGRGGRADSVGEWEEIVANALGSALPRACRNLPTNDGGRFMAGFTPWATGSRLLREWCHDPELPGAVNHNSRAHIPEDIRRYVFCAQFGLNHPHSPRLKDFPAHLLPRHENVAGDLENVPHADRFKVQLANRPSSTITSHIAKDGHHFIHYDPNQARSLSVREAARVQTFPDNYLFCGNVTQQYTQVGNAVPPYLAKKIAEAVATLVGSNRTGPQDMIA